MSHRWSVAVVLPLGLACAGGGLAEVVEPPAAPPPVPERWTPTEAEARGLLVGTWTHSGSRLSLDEDGRFELDGTDPCGADGGRGSWRVSRVTPSWINADLVYEDTNQGALFVVLGVPLQPEKRVEAIGLDCAASPGEMEVSTYWARVP